MKSYIVYADDGTILRTGRCIDSDFSLQGDNVIEGECRDDENYKVINGQLVHSPKVDTVDEVQTKIRRERNIRLSQSDWTQVPDSPVDSTAWATYRQALRDLPAQYQSETDFANVVFPNPPE